MAAYVLGVVQETYMPTPERLEAVGGAQKDAKWCILLHFGYKICLVKTLNRRFATSW
jgi:hypothetical protein